jgi:translation elongation factor EF-Tu-like GTPase
LSKI